MLDIAQASKLNVISKFNYEQFSALIILKSEILAYRHVFVVAGLVVIVGSFTALWIKIDKERTDIKVHVE